MILERYLRGESDEIESRASKWSDRWLEEQPSVFEQEQEQPQLKPDSTQQPAATTASNTTKSNHNGSGLPSNSEQEKAILTSPIRAINSRNGIYKG